MNVLVQLFVFAVYLVAGSVVDFDQRLVVIGFRRPDLCGEVGLAAVVIVVLDVFVQVKF